MIALLIGLLFLIRRTQRIRQQHSQSTPSTAAKPFPQTSTYAHDISSSTKVELRDRQAALRQAFTEWQSTYLLRGLDGNTEFLRGETHKRGLRYQLTCTSLAQGLALFIQVQMAQDGDESRSRFERLLAYLLAHPAQDQPALSSWLSMPDLPSSSRLEPDPHAEAWILCALQAAGQQWGNLQRFDLDQIFQERSKALLDVLESESEDHLGIFSPLLFRAIAQQAPDKAWQTQANSDWQMLRPLLRDEYGLPGRREALGLLQIGLDGLLFPNNGFAGRSDLCFARMKRALSDQEPLEGEVEEGFSRLASLSCCVPLALLDKDGGYPDQLLSRLSQARPAKQDALGASLQLIAMMSMSGTLWSD
jgi:hypothetical protein